MAFVLKFIKLAKTKSPQKFQNNNDFNNMTLSDEEILAAKEYFFRKVTLEVKKFIKPTQYQKISIDRDGFLYSLLQWKYPTYRQYQDNWWGIYSNERLSRRHILCINHKQALTFGIQFNQWSALAFKGSNAFWCWNREEICTQDWIHNLWKILGEENIKLNLRDASIWGRKLLTRKWGQYQNIA